MLSAKMTVPWLLACSQLVFGANGSGLGSSVHTISCPEEVPLFAASLQDNGIAFTQTGPATFAIAQEHDAEVTRLIIEIHNKRLPPGRAFASNLEPGHKNVWLGLKTLTASA